MLKTFAGAVALVLILATMLPVRADSFLTGAIRDGMGVAMSGARVSLLDRAGSVVARDVAIADGTFALDQPAAAVTIAITCDYCMPVSRSIGPPGEPVVVIVKRYSEIAPDGPSPADIRALPYRSAADIASLRPWSVVDAGRISDRGLDAYGATLVNGLPFYSAADGDDNVRLVPAHAIAALNTASALNAPVYGGYASAGIDDLQLSDPDVSTTRLDAGNGFDLVGRLSAPNIDALGASSNDAGDRRELVSGNAGVPLAGGQLSIDALDMADEESHASGAGLAYATDSRRYATAASVRATQTGDGSLLTFDAHVRNRGPLALEFGVRAMRATVDGSVTGPLAGIGPGTQSDAALYVDATRQVAAQTTSAQIAFDRGSDSGAQSLRAGALIGSLSNDLRLNANWTLHSGVVSNLRIPTFAELYAAAPQAVAGDRSLLFEQSLQYTDLRRLRLAGVTYTERMTGSSPMRINGIGIQAGWQIAPQLSLQAWLLRANRSTVTSYAASPLVLEFTTNADPITRQLVWLTYDRAVRVDALVRGGALEGDVRIPLDARYALALGTVTYNQKRVTTLGVTLR